MKPLPAILLLATAALLTAQTPQIRSPAPVKNFSLPFFDESGHRTLLVRGTEAILTEPRRPAFSDVTVSEFAGDESNRVIAVLLSQAAVVDTESRSIEGSAAVRFVRDDIEVTGESWRYAHDARHLTIQRRARVVINAELPNLIK